MTIAADILRMMDGRDLVTAAEVSTTLSISERTAVTKLLQLVYSGDLLRQPMYHPSTGSRSAHRYWRTRNPEPAPLAYENFLPAIKILIFLQQNGGAGMEELLQLLERKSKGGLFLKLANLRTLGLVEVKAEKFINRGGRRHSYWWRKDWAEGEGNELPEDLVTSVKDPADCSRFLRLLKHKGSMSSKELQRGFQFKLPIGKVYSLGLTLEHMGLVEFVWIDATLTTKARMGYRLAKVLQTKTGCCELME